MEKGKCRFCNEYLTPEKVLMESKYSFVVMDKYPLRHGHSLVVPKEHRESLLEMSEEELSDIILLIKRWEAFLVASLKPEGIDVRQHYRPFLEETKLKVDHVHFHILPRGNMDDLFMKAGIHERDLRRVLKDGDVSKFKNMVKEFEKSS